MLIWGCTHFWCQCISNQFEYQCPQALAVYMELFTVLLRRQGPAGQHLVDYFTEAVAELREGLRKVGGW